MTRSKETSAIDVVIAGQSFSVLSDDDESHVREVAALVDHRMRELGGAAPAAFATAVITALNIASDYQKLKDQLGELERTIDRLTARLEEPLPGEWQTGKEQGFAERAVPSAEPGEAEGALGDAAKAVDR